MVLTLSAVVRVDGEGHIRAKPVRSCGDSSAHLEEVVWFADVALLRRSGGVVASPVGPRIAGVRHKVILYRHKTRRVNDENNAIRKLGNKNVYTYTTSEKLLLKQ